MTASAPPQETTQPQRENSKRRGLRQFGPKKKHERWIDVSAAFYWLIGPSAAWYWLLESLFATFQVGNHTIVSWICVPLALLPFVIACFFQKGKKKAAFGYFIVVLAYPVIIPTAVYYAIRNIIRLLSVFTDVPALIVYLYTLPLLYLVACITHVELLNAVFCWLIAVFNTMLVIAAVRWAASPLHLLLVIERTLIILLKDGKETWFQKPGTWTRMALVIPWWIEKYLLSWAGKSDLELRRMLAPSLVGGYFALFGFTCASFSVIYFSLANRTTFQHFSGLSPAFVDSLLYSISVSATSGLSDVMLLSLLSKAAYVLQTVTTFLLLASVVMTFSAAISAHGETAIAQVGKKRRLIQSLLNELRAKMLRDVAIHEAEEAKKSVSE